MYNVQHSVYSIPHIQIVSTTFFSLLCTYWSTPIVSNFCKFLSQPGAYYWIENYHCVDINISPALCWEVEESRDIPGDNPISLLTNNSVRPSQTIHIFNLPSKNSSHCWSKVIIVLVSCDIIRGIPPVVISLVVSFIFAEARCLLLLIANEKRQCVITTELPRYQHNNCLANIFTATNIKTTSR